MHDDRLEILLCLEFLQLKHDQVLAKLDVGLSLEVARVDAVLCIGLQCSCQSGQVSLDLAFVTQPPGAQQVIDIRDRRGFFLLIPYALDRCGQGGIAVVIQRAAGTGHLGHQGQQHFHVVVDIDDHGKRIETDRVGSLIGELDELPVQKLGQIAVGAADVDDPDLGPGAQIAEGHFVHEDRLAGTGQRRDGEVVVAARVVEEIEAHDLPAATEQGHDRGRGALPFRHQGRGHHRVVGGLGAGTAEQLEILLQCRGQGARHRRHKCLMLQIDILGQVETARAPDGPDGMFGPGYILDSREQDDLVIHLDHVAAVVEGAQHHVPVALAILKVWLEMGHVGTGSLSRSRRLHQRLASGRLVIQGDGPHGDEKRTRYREGHLVVVADHRAHVAHPEILRVLPHGEALHRGLGAPRLSIFDEGIGDSGGNFRIRHLTAKGARTVVFDVPFFRLSKHPLVVKEVRDEVQQAFRPPVPARHVGRAQGGVGTLLDPDRLLHIGGTLGIQRRADGNDAAVVTKQIDVMREERFGRALQIVIDPAPAEHSIDVPVATGLPFRSSRLLIHRKHVGLLSQRRKDMRTGVQRDLDARTRGTGHEQTGQHPFHFFIGSGLRDSLDAKAHGMCGPSAECALIEHKHPLVCHPPQVRQDAGESWQRGDAIQQAALNRIGGLESLAIEDRFEGLQHAHSRSSASAPVPPGPMA